MIEKLPLLVLLEKKQSVFAVSENIFEKLHPVDKEKVIKYLKGLKKFVLENVKNDTLRGLIEKCFECGVEINGL